ncbi:hypothetical protein HJC23_000907 [Cyclotella cryptica]|uniref:Uncharacterized protein n=1 Tax=Cyclotella cryptica TaxID=29204 RepID=A0ABD3QMP0_9STRA|eukprot:CCRYP_004011-RA/>CCRYP_004011-RA protein AED:0.00 eAED:0.00 QI:155/-1/1/1/-1/1/1/673/516
MRDLVYKLVVLAAALSPQASKAFAPVTVSKTSRISDCPIPVSIYAKDCQRHLRASPSSDEESGNESSAEVRKKSLKSFLRRKSKPVTFAIATAASFVSCLPGQPSRQSLFRPAAAQASAPIVLRAAKPKDDPPMVQAMKKAEQLKKQRSMEEFDRFMQKCNDIEDSQGKKARDDYERQYQAERQANEAKKAIDLENLKRDLLDEGKDPNTDLDAEREVFQFEHDIDLAKVPGTPQNEQMIRNFRSRGKNTPTFESQRYIVKCQVEDLKARGVDPLAHFSQPEVMDKTRAIYKMDNKVAAKVAKQYEALMDQYGGRLTPAQEGEVPFVRSSVGDEPIVQSSETAREKRAAEKAAAKEKRAAEKEAAKKEREAQKRARAEAKAKAKADRAASKGKQTLKTTPSKDSATLPTLSDEPAAKSADDAMDDAFQRDEIKTTTVSISSKTKGSSLGRSISNLKKKLPVKQTAVVVVGAGSVAFGYKYYSASNNAKRSQQYRSIMGGEDDDDFEDDDDDDDDEY